MDRSILDELTLDFVDEYYDQGYELGVKHGKAEGREEAEKEAGAEGYNTGWSDGYEEGYSTGWNEGYEKGCILNVESKRHWRKILTTAYLGGFDLDDGQGKFEEIAVTIKNATQEAVKDQNGKDETCLVLHFSEKN